MLEALCLLPSEPKRWPESKRLSAKMVFLLAKTSEKKAGKPHTLFLCQMCMCRKSSFPPTRLSALHAGQASELAAYDLAHQQCEEDETQRLNPLWSSSQILFSLRLSFRSWICPVEIEVLHINCCVKPLTEKNPLK